MLRESVKIYGKRNHRQRGQVGIELVIGMIVVFLLLYGMIRVFLYVNTAMVRRQQAYNSTRNQITASDGRYLNFYQHHDYHVFSQDGDLYEERPEYYE